jgi:hypothetical protein
MRIQKTLLALSVMTTFIQPLWAQHSHDAGKKFPSPDGQFAFRYAAGEPTEETEEETEVFNLINRGSGKVLLEVAKSDPDFGPSGRFELKVLWKPDWLRVILLLLPFPGVEIHRLTLSVL